MINPEFKKEKFKKDLRDAVKMLFRTTLEEATAHQIYQAVCHVVKDVIIDNWMKTQQQMKKDIHDLTDAKQNIVRIGVSHAYARAILPLMLLKLYAAFPQINAQVFEIGYEQMKLYLML